MLSAGSTRPAPGLQYLTSSEGMATDVAREARVAHPQLAAKRRGADNLLLAALELVDVPGCEDDLSVEELGLG